MEKRWMVAARDDAADAALARRLGVSPLTAGILRRRGADDERKARAFLHPETEQAFYDPFLMQEMDRAVARIRRAVENGERVAVYGDYDVDGVTATALLVRALRRLGADVRFYIPSRRAEGYGLHEEALNRLAADGVRLTVTVDCGISGRAEVEAMRGRMDMIVTDHHLPGGALPEACAVLDPHRADCGYPFKELAGVGVAFKLCQALFQEMRGEAFEDDLELAALGTVADIVPLREENRKLVKLGLARMADTPILGLRALLEASGLAGRAVTSGQAGFVLAPRLNAAGRLAEAVRCVSLFLSEDEAEARAAANELNELNGERQRVEADILERARAQIESAHGAEARVIVAAGEGWHPGVIGIVASRLVEIYYRPVLVVSLQDGVGKGSGRSIRGFHLFEALDAVKDTLVQFGGHAMAAGFTVARDRVDALRAALDAYAAARLTEADYVPLLHAEAALRPEEASLPLAEELALLEPYGMANPRPVFVCRELMGREARAIGREGRHLQFRAGDGPDAPRAVGWSMGGQTALVGGGRIDMAYTLELDEWNGRRYIQCRLADLRAAESQRVFPTRPILGAIYTALKKWQAAGSIPLDGGTLAARCGVSLYTMETALRVFRELGLVTRDGETLRVPPQPRQKLDLMDSDTYRQGAEKQQIEPIA